MLPAYCHPADEETGKLTDQGYNTNTIDFFFLTDCNGTWTGCHMPGSQKTSTEKAMVTKTFSLVAKDL